MTQLHPLHERIDRLRAQTRRLAMLFGAGRVIAAGMATAIVLGLLDFFVRLEDRGLRVLASLAFAAAIGGAWQRYLYRTSNASLDDLSLARHVQRRFPRLGDSLATAVEFLSPERGAGSPAIRQAVVKAATDRAGRVDFLDALDRRPAWRSLLAAAAATLVALVLTILGPLQSGVALARLVNPFSDIAYPRAYHLMVVDPVELVARGHAFRIEVVDENGRELPSSVRVFFLEENGGATTVAADWMDVRETRATAVKKDVQRAFAYRIEGGDDHSMPWQSVEVADAPRVDAFTVRIVPPAYTGWPATTGQRDIRAIVGSRATIAGRATRPLNSVAVRLHDGGEIEGSVADDGSSFTIGGEGQSPLVIEKSQSYRFHLVATDGLPGGDDSQWDIHAIADAPPAVTLDRPSGTTYVTPSATVPLRASAQDDLGVARIEVEYRVVRAAEGADAWRPIGPPLYAAAAPAGRGVPTAEPAADARTVAGSWSLADLELRAGTEIEVRATAADFHSQVAHGEPRRLAIISPEDLAARLALRQDSLVQELTRLLEIQQQARRQVAEIERRLRQPLPVTRAEVDRLRAAELNQRQMAQSLTSRDEGAAALVLQLLSDLATNKVDSPDVQRRMRAVLAEIDRLAAGELAAVNQELNAAVKTAESLLAEPAAPSERRDATAAALGRAGKSQDGVIAALEKLLDELNRWGRFRHFHRDLGQLLRDQKTLADQTVEVGRRTLTREFEDLPPQDQADLAAAARQQLDLVDRLERIVLELSQTAQALGGPDPLAAEALGDAVTFAHSRGTSGEMRTTAANLQRNQVGQAIGRQQQILVELAEMLDILANRREHEMGRLIERLDQADEALATLQRSEDDLRRQIEQAEALPAAERAARLAQLASRQAELAAEAKRIADGLKRLAASAPAAGADEAAGHLNDSAARAANNQPGAGQAAAAGLKAIDDARQRLRRQREQSQSEISQEQLNRAAREARSLARRQEKLRAETAALAQQSPQAALPSTDPRLTALVAQQKALAGETGNLASRLSPPAFRNVLSTVTADMSAALALIERGQLGEATQQPQHRAAARLNQVAAALEPAAAGENEPANSTDQGTEQRKPDAGGPPEQAAQIQLVKLLQQDLNEQVRALDARKNKEPAAALAPEYRRLTEEQARLRQLLLEIVRPSGTAEPPREKSS